MTEDLSQAVHDLISGETGNAALYIQLNSLQRGELLIRPTGRDGQVLSPIQFVSAANTLGLAAEIDLWVACQANKVREALRTAGISIPLSINVTAASVLSPRRLFTALKPPFRLEITEALRITSVGATRLLDFSKAAVEAGFSVSLDDLTETPDAIARWELLKEHLAEIKLDLGDGTALGGALQLEHKGPAAALEVAIDLTRAALERDIDVVLERGDAGKAAGFLKLLDQSGIDVDRVARQDFDVHRPESLNDFTRRERPGRLSAGL